jgi:YidC/Oxa1 family membrane protein insertase
VIIALLGPIEDLLRTVLDWLHDSAGLPWAWSIVALTLIVRMLLVPLTVRQIHSMQSLQRHMPEMKALQNRYKHDKKRQQEELMKFYRENSINPAASCLPLVAQLPVFIALYFVLRDLSNEKGLTGLGWLGFVPDITEHAGTHWSGYLLLAIYMTSQVASTYFMSTTMQRSQRILMMILPLFFVTFLVNFPIGLVIYWVTTNLWTVGQGLVTRRLVPKTPQVPAKRSSRTPPRAEERDDGARRPPEEEKKPEPVAGPPVRRVKRKKKKRARR